MSFITFTPPSAAVPAFNNNEIVVNRYAFAACRTAWQQNSMESPFPLALRIFNKDGQVLDLQEIAFQYTRQQTHKRKDKSRSKTTRHKSSSHQYNDDDGSKEDEDNMESLS